MGAKQSKRSVDISGKEAESAGEVAVSGAGGEGRVEQLADADSLKPQLNGDAHIHEQQTDKEKQLDSGTPENEKDATTEKENKPEEDSEPAPVINGDSEPKVENGESSPAQEDTKKPKKEKVKKKWSLRSISFSRKDKPKQEKKQKDDEQKTNGEPEKVPEEAGDVPAEPVVSEVAEEVQAQAQTEVTEEKTPETPVTEPLTNGSSTPESVPEESPAASPLAEAAAAAPAEEPASAPAPVLEPVSTEPAEPEHLPINGLSLEEPKLEIPQVEVIVQKEPEEPTVTESPPAPEISVKKEEPVAVSDKMAELIPEIPSVPELPTETLQETTSDVAVAN